MLASSDQTAPGDSAGRPIVATLLDFDNLVDYAYLFAGWMAIIRQILFVEYGLEKPFMSLYCGSAWLRILELGTGGYWGVEADAADVDFFWDAFLASSCVEDTLNG